MLRSQTATARQRRRVQTHIENADADGFFNRLTGPQRFDDVASLSPEHRERLFPPAATLSMFMAQSLSADGSCRQAVDEAAVTRSITGMTPCSSNTAADGKARVRLAPDLVETLARRTGKRVADGLREG